MKKSELRELIKEELKKEANAITASPELNKALVKFVGHFTASSLVEELEIAFDEAEVSASFKKGFLKSVSKRIK